MLKLYGFSVSNYYNMVKLALLEKGLPFEEVTFYGGRAPRRWRSARAARCRCWGRAGLYQRNRVILEYIEQTQQGTPLLPSDPFERAGVGAAKEIELYIELPARACYAEAFFGMTVPDAIKEKDQSRVAAGFAAWADTASSRRMWRATA
jgi:glutathione S-transferase